MDIRSFFNRSAAARKSPNVGIKDKLRTPERKNSSKESLRSLEENEVVKKDSKVLRKKTAREIAPSIAENSKKRKSVPVSMSSDSDAENPIPSKLSKLIKNDKSEKLIENGDKRPKSKKKRILIDDSDSSDDNAVREMPVNSYTKIQKRIEKSKTQLPVTVVDKKTKRVKDNILRVVEVASSSEEESDDFTTVKKSRKQSQRDALNCGLLKENVAKMLKKQQPLQIKNGRKDDKEGRQRRKSNEKEQSTKSNNREENRKNNAGEHPLVKLNPISVSDFFGGTKIKSKNLDDGKKLAECRKKERRDDSFDDALEQAEADLLSPASTLKHSPLVTPIKKKSNEVENNAKTLNIGEFKQKTPRKSPRIAIKQNVALNVTQNRSKIKEDDKISPLTPMSAEKQVHGRAEVEKKPTPRKTSLKKQAPSNTSVKTPCPSVASSSQESQISLKSSQQSSSDSFAQFVDRYKPKSAKQIIGQQGEKSCVNKLLNWLKNWNAWHVTKTKEKKKGFGANDDGSWTRCILLSGPPGIGKTTSAELCCKELGIKFISQNASDTRNKKSLEQRVMGMISSKNIDQCFDSNNVSDTMKSTVPTHALIMDEVDGMAGNEDRAGISELIIFVKNTKIPIICICNDRQAQKIRSLANYCYDLRFHRPQVSHIKGPMMSVAFKENIKISPQQLEQVIEASNHDVRQVMHRLSLLTPNPDAKSSVSDSKSHDIALSRKDLTTNIFETVREIFSDNRDGQKTRTLHERCELFFSDYSLTPLFVFENYLNVEMKDIKKVNEKLNAISSAASYLAIGDIIEKQIRTDGNWSLLNDQAIFSVVAPAEKVKGYLKGAAQFPQWFGKNSKQNKFSRMLGQIQMHTCLKISCNTKSFNLDYAPVLREKLLQPLLSSEKDGPQTSFSVLQYYDLTKEDMDDILDLTQYPDTKDSFSKVPTKTKSAFTRLYNKTPIRLPFSNVGDVMTARKGKKATKLPGEVENNEQIEDPDQIDTAETDEFVVDY